MLQRHYRSHTKETLLLAMLVIKSLLKKQLEKKHQTIHSDIKTRNDSKAFQSGVCLKRFPFKSQIQIHYRAHTGEKPFACQIFGRKFASKIY